MKVQTFVAESTEMKRILHLVDKVAPTDVTVLVEGEQGVGRKALARYIHNKSPRFDAPFIGVNMAASSGLDLGTTLFGQTRPSSAVKRKPRNSLIRTAQGGTLLLENIEEIPSSLQSLLLSFLDSREFTLSGSSRPVRMDVRVIATASPLLEQYVKRGTFRADLYYRLRIIALNIPPLRERRDDILPLSRNFIKSVSPGKQLSMSAVERLVEYPWPGNALELKNIITRACLLSKGKRIEVDDLSLEPVRERPAAEQVIQELKLRLADTENQVSTLTALTIVASPIWEGRRFVTEPDLCFVLMPFNRTHDIQRVYTDHVKSTVELCGMRCVRADDIYDVAGVMQSIWDAINRSRVVIAEMTGRNPNVFYELGIAHTLGKPVIMITQSVDDVPFDLKHLRCLVYEYKPKAIERFQDALKRTLTTVLQTPIADVIV